MSSEFCYLSDIANIQGGYAFKSADFKNEGVAIIKIANIRPPLVSLDGVDRVSPEKLQGLERFRLKDGDILMAMTGATVGKVARFKDIEPAYLNQRVAKISSRNGPEFDDFIYAVISQPGFDSLIEGAAAGSAQANISAAGIGAVQIPRLSASEQIHIGEIARCIDDRITLLRETNTTLEAIAQALFKSWFVDFDPVHAKHQGRAPEGMDAQTAALFPDAFEESELGMVPKGWIPARLDSFVELAYGKALKAEARIAGDVPVYGSGGITGWHNAALVNQPSIIVGRKGTVGSLYWENRPFFPIDTVFYVKTEKPLTYVFQVLKSLGLSDMNTDAAVPGLNRENAYRLLVAGASEEVIKAFDSIASDLRMSVVHNLRQIETLESTRDTLLPRLISGQLRLPEAQAMVEDVVDA